MKVLVIDDEKDILELITAMLTNEGYDVVSAEDGERGLEMLNAIDDIEIVITDLIMPNKEGIETILELRRVRPDVKILAMSGGGRGGAATYLSTAKNIGAAATLAKPFRKQALLDAIESVKNA